jgi:hypothetical protein
MVVVVARCIAKRHRRSHVTHKEHNKLEARSYSRQLTQLQYKYWFHPLIPIPLAA